MTDGAASDPSWVRWLELLACLALLAMLILTVADVLGRYVISRPVPGVTELVQYTMVLVVFAGLPVVTHRRSHISVALFDKSFGPRGQRVQQAFVMAGCAAILGAQAVVLFQHALGQRESADVIGSLRLLVYPAGFFMAALSAVAAVVCARAIWRPSAGAASANH